jgi:hypothetical protein
MSWNGGSAKLAGRLFPTNEWRRRLLCDIVAQNREAGPWENFEPIAVD